MPARKASTFSKAPKVKTSNAFDCLEDDGASDDDAPEDGLPDNPRWPWMASLSEADLVPPAISSPPRPTASLSTDSPSSTLCPSTSDGIHASPFPNASRFVAAFGPIPRVPTSKKSVQTLEGESLWTMSKEERRKLFANWQDRALEEGNERQFAQLDRARRDHARAREENEQLQTQVIPVSAPLLRNQ